MWVRLFRVDGTFADILKSKSRCLKRRFDGVSGLGVTRPGQCQESGEREGLEASFWGLRRMRLL